MDNDQIWSPINGPQRYAYESAADILLFGGGWGAGKTELLVGNAAVKQIRSLLVRRDSKFLRILSDRIAQIVDDGAMCGGRSIDVASFMHDSDDLRFYGNIFDFVGVDEVCQFTERQFRFLTSLVFAQSRSPKSRVIAVGSLPASAIGNWVLGFWAPWLDPNHPKPAMPGELRWFITAGGRDIETPDASPVVFANDVYKPVSRTYIPAE